MEESRKATKDQLSSQSLSIQFWLSLRLSPSKNEYGT